MIDIASAMREWDWAAIREWTQIALLAVAAFAAVGAARYGRRAAKAASDSAKAALDTAGTTARALEMDIGRLERLRDAEEAARKPRVIIELIRPARGLDVVSTAQAVVRNAGGSPAKDIFVFLGDLDRGTRFEGRAPGLAVDGDATVPCTRNGGAAGLPVGNGWVASATWVDEAGEQYGRAGQWVSVRYDDPPPPPPRGAARLDW